MSGLTTEEAKALESLLPYISFEEKGIGGKPTIRFTGAKSRS